MRRTLLLSRHGETDWNRENRWQGRTDVPLNDTGRAQAALLADKLRQFKIDRVHASDLVRAQETAGIVARVLGLPFLGTDEGFRERGFGVFEGLTREECEARYPEAWQAYKADNRQMPPGAETQSEVMTRMVEAARRVAQHPSSRVGEVVLVVSHGSAIRSLVAHATGTLPPGLFNGATWRVNMHGVDFEPDAELVIEEV